jgi:hypothetical protein
MTDDLYFLQQATVRFYWIIMVTTQRSVQYFGFLVGVLYGSMLKFLEMNRDHKMLYVGRKERIGKI